MWIHTGKPAIALTPFNMLLTVNVANPLASTLITCNFGGCHDKNLTKCTIENPVLVQRFF
jgi:hypothetical protein